MEAKTKTYNFKILNEEVADEDFFEDQTHENIAETIHKLISTSEKASTIGLEGDWGSGKSTVVEILRNKVDKKTLFFQFDAWAHEGDPLRRVFLESLINEIDKYESEEDLQETKKKISLKTKTVEIKSSKLTSKLGAGLSIAAMLVPIGIALINFIEPESITFDITDELEPHWLAIIALFFICTPVLYLIYWALCGDLNDEGKKDWSFFQSKSEDTYNQDIVEEGERTSVEFEEYFKGILGEYVGKGKKFERAIIVVDNLDRVSQEEFLKIWSTLQAFFQHRNSRQRDEYMEKSWFIVPFDRKGLEIPLSRMRQNAPGLVATENGEVIVSNIEPLTKEKRDVAKSFIDKSFQIILDVPSPIMSGWDKYLSEHVNEALTSWDVGEKQVAMELFRKYAALKCSQSPTPRIIRNYINQLGAIRLRYSEGFNVKYLAAYTILKFDYTREDLQRIIINKDPPNYISSVDQEELYESLAALLFGVDRTKGLQLLIAPKIKDYLIEGECEKVRKLLSNYGSTFWVFWKTAWHLISPTPTLNDTAKYNLVKVLDETFNDYQYIKEEIEELANSILSSASQSNYLDIDHFDMLHRLGKLNEHSKQYYEKLSDFNERLKQEYSNRLPESERKAKHKLISKIDEVLQDRHY